MGYSLKRNRCQRWWQGVHRANDGLSTSSAQFPTQEEAVAAIHHHHRSGKWPREVEEKTVSICPECGQPRPS